MSTSSKSQGVVIPCQCEVGDGRPLSFADLRYVLTKSCVGDSVNVKCLAVSGCCFDDAHPPGMEWLVDFESGTGASKVDDSLDHTVQNLMKILKGKVLGYGSDFIRTSVPVTKSRTTKNMKRNLSSLDLNLQP